MLSRFRFDVLKIIDYPIVRPDLKHTIEFFPRYVLLVEETGVPVTVFEPFALDFCLHYSASYLHASWRSICSLTSF